MLDHLLDSGVLKVNRSPDFDRFRSIASLGDHKSMPLHGPESAASFATVSLRSCSIFLQRTFPRILQAQYRSTGAIVGFGMDDAVSAVLDGKEVGPCSMLSIMGEATCEFIEPQANLIAFVKFDTIGDRGWPGQAGAIKVVTAQPAALNALRSVTRDILLLASNSADLFAQPQMVGHLEESLLQATDHALLGAVSPDGAGSADLGGYLKLIRRLDDFLHHNAAKALHSAELASGLGVSVRTLHNAVNAIRGLSLHRYVRLKRLWNVRQQLIRSVGDEAVISIALANGFWHMGEFRALYRDLFGETPQQTRERARPR